MSARDEFDEIHTRLMADVKRHPDYVANHFGSIYGYSEGAEHALDTVRALGYVKHRTITTVEELDALPVESIIFDSDPDALIKVKGGWLSIQDYDGMPYSSASVTFPVTVLHEPEVQP